MKHTAIKLLSANGTFLTVNTDSGHAVFHCFRKEGEKEFSIFATEEHCQDTLDTASAYLKAINAGN